MGVLCAAAMSLAALSGTWTFEAKTDDGDVRAKLVLQQNRGALSATMFIDNHELKGNGQTDGTQFDVVLVHADGSGPGHSERLRLRGKLADGKLSGQWDDGATSGSWTATRAE